jgi:hypothetical protein
MQLTVNTVKATLEQLSTNAPITAAIKTAEQLINDNKDDTLGVQKVTNDMEDALRRV